MDFSKRPDGKWCGFSAISESFYDLSLKEGQCLLTSVLSDVASNVASHYYSLLNEGGTDFDYVIRTFKLYKDEPRTARFWREYFKSCGCDERQMEIVERRINSLKEEGYIVEEFALSGYVVVFYTVEIVSGVPMAAEIDVSDAFGEKKAALLYARRNRGDRDFVVRRIGLCETDVKSNS